MALGRAGTCEPGPVALDAVLSDLASLLAGSIGDRVSVQMEPAAGLQVLSSPAELEQVLLNLAVNGAEAMPEGGQLKIAAGLASARAVAEAGLASRRDGYVRVDVHDAGTGMDAETMARAREPYFSTKGSDGNGLGLAMAQQILRDQGGTLQITSRLGEGTTVTVLLPRSVAGVEAQEPRAGDGSGSAGRADVRPGDAGAGGGRPGGDSRGVPGDSARGGLCGGGGAGRGGGAAAGGGVATGSGATGCGDAGLVGPGDV